MRYSFDIWNCLCKIMDAFVLVYVPLRLFPLRRLIWPRKTVFWGSLLIMSLVAYGADFLFYEVPFQVTLFLYVIMGLCYTCLLFHGQFYLKAIVVGACISTFMPARFVIGVLLSQINNELRLFSPEMTIVSTVFLFALTLFFIKITVIPKVQLPPQYGISMSAFMIATALSTDIIKVLAEQINNWAVELGLFMFPMVTVLFLYFLFFRIVREYEEKNAFKLMIQQMDAQQKHLLESKQIHSELRNLRHELKNHVFYMQSLLRQDRTQELEQYFNQVYRQEYGIDMIDSGSDAIDALLSQKTSFAKSKGIQISIQTALPESLFIDEGKLCTVLSNLLDNAIEACEAIISPSILLTVQQTGSYIHVLCKNSVTYDICNANPNLQTTKSQGNHGIGLQIVRAIVQEHDGMMEYHMEDSTMFVVSLMLKIQANKSSRPEGIKPKDILRMQ